ncbi:MAG: VWA domain-containing protein [Gammaproteobacteria bacterium]|nr:VWA domain-containing protein [Gammaproteobacteria bacterium]
MVSLPKGFDAVMELSFNYPLFALLAVLVPLLWFYPSRPKRVWHGVIRTLVFLSLVVGLMQPVVVSNLPNKHYAVILDQSNSLSEESKARAVELAEDVISKFSGEGSVSVVQIGGTEQAVDTLNFVHMNADEKSPLGDALEIAAQSIPFGVSGSVTVVSDGLATDRHWGRAFDLLQEREIPVHNISIDPVPDVYISDVRSTDVRPGEKVSLFVEIIGTVPELEVTAIHDDEVIAQVDGLASDGRTTVLLEFKTDEPGFMDVEVEVSVPEDQDSDLTNNLWRHVVAIQDPIRVLYLGNRQAGAESPLSELLGAGFEIEAPVASSVTEDNDLSKYDVVMLDDAPTSVVEERVQNKIADAVQNDGLGLIHSGGEAAFGDGGYHDSPLSDLFPVDIPGDQDKIDPSVGLAIILDTSGSMAGTRIELAKHIARIAVRRMKPHDRIGIVEFYGNKHWAVPMQPATNKIEIDRAIGRMKAIGGTVLFPAIQEAYYGLQNVNTRFKHIVLITDAGVEDSPYESMTRRINRDRITVSTILVGQGGHNLIMSDIANWGGGRFYAVGNQFQLVEMIFKQTSTKKSPMYKRGLFDLETSRGQGWWGDVQTDEVPALNGYVEVEARDGAEVLVEVEDTEHPVLATWRYGLGRVTTLMTEPVGEGTRNWGAWEEYPEFLGRIVRRNASFTNSFEIDTQRRFGKTTVVANRVSPNEALVPEAQLYNLDSSLVENDRHAFTETAPGLFELDLFSGSEEDLLIGISGSANESIWRSASLAVSDEVQENQVDPMDALDLAGLSEATGGLSLLELDDDSIALASVSSGELSFVVVQVWPWLLLLAILFYLGDLLYRRWPRGS